MYPVICTIGSISIYSYGLMLVLAFFIATYLAAKEARIKGINPDTIWNLSFIGIISGIIGARLFYVLENFRAYLEQPLEILRLYHGGLSWFGGLATAILCATYYLKKKHLPIYRVLDLLAPYIALAQGIGRIGCLLNGCCYGRPTSWGIYFPVHDNILIPTQIYSSISLLVIFVILRFLQTKPYKDGFIIYTYFLLYAIKRFLIEFWRADNPAVIFGLTLFQIISIVLFAFSIIKLIQSKKSKT